MLNFILGFVVAGIIAGIVMGLIIKRNRNGRQLPPPPTPPQAGGEDDKGGLATEAMEQKAENIAKLKDYIEKLEMTPLDSSASNGASLNNEDVRKLLGVSDATACRYLDDLEKEGLIKQVGTDGPKVYYKINN